MPSAPRGKRTRLGHTGLCSRLRLSGDGHGKIGQIHAQAAFGVDRCFRRDVGGGYGNPQLLRLPRAGLATATPKTNFTACNKGATAHVSGING
jgi:hypothetical protein